MPSPRFLLPGLVAILAACASSRSPRSTTPTATRPRVEAPEVATAPSPEPPGTTSVLGAGAPPIVAIPVSPIPAAPVGPAAVAPVVEPEGLRPAVPAAPLPGTRAVSTPAPSAPAAPGITPPAPRATTAAFAWPTTLPAFLTELRRRARSGEEPELAPVADLLDEIATASPGVGAPLSIERRRDLEARERAAFGRGTGWCTLTSFVEPGADATAMRASYLDLDRVAEYTGRPGASVVRREGDVTIGRTDAIRRALTFEFGARWTFRAKSLDRGPARLVVTSMLPAADTLHMLTTRGVMVAFPARDGLFVAEMNVSVVDFEVPGLLRGSAEGIARKELLARIEGIRAHWRDYPR